MKDLILKSLMDLCAEVLLKNSEYVDASKLPQELTEELSYKSCSRWRDHRERDPGKVGIKPTYSYHIKEPERFTSRRSYANEIRKCLNNMYSVHGEENRIKEVYALFEYMLQEKHLFEIIACENSGGFGKIVKHKLIIFWHKYHLDRMKEYWVQLFDEPFPNKKKQKWCVLDGKSVEELSYKELNSMIFLLTEHASRFTSMEELQDRLREALTVFDE